MMWNWFLARLRKKPVGLEKSAAAARRRTRLSLAGIWLVSMLATMVLLYHVHPGWHSVCVGFYDGILESMAPKDPRWAADGIDDDVFDDDAESVAADQDALTVVYGDDRDFVAPRAELLDMIRLNRYLDEAALSWINTHTGTQYIVYTFTAGGLTWHYYQHMHDQGYVFCRHE